MKGKRSFKRLLAVMMAVVFTVTGITFTPSEKDANAAITYTDVPTSPIPNFIDNSWQAFGFHDGTYTASPNTPAGYSGGGIGSTSIDYRTSDNSDGLNRIVIPLKNSGINAMIPGGMRAGTTYYYMITVESDAEFPAHAYQQYYEAFDGSGTITSPDNGQKINNGFTFFRGTFTPNANYESRDFGRSIFFFHSTGVAHMHISIQFRTSEIPTSVGPTSATTTTAAPTTTTTTAAPTTTAEPTTAAPNPWSETSISGLYYEATVPRKPLSLFTRVVEGNGTIADAYGDFYLHVAPENFSSVGGPYYTLYFGEGNTTDPEDLDEIEYGTGNINVYGGQYINFGIGLTALGVEDDKYYSMIVTYTLNNTDYKNTYWFYTGSTRPSGGDSPVDPSNVTATESNTRGEKIDVNITADSSAPAGEKYNVYIDNVKVGDKVNAGSHSFDATVGTHTVVVKGDVSGTESTGVTVSDVAVTWYKAGNWVSGPADYEFYEEGSYGQVDYKGSNLSNMSVRVDASSGNILSDYGTQMRIENADLYSGLTDGRKYTLTYTFRSSQAGHIAWIQGPTEYYGAADDITVTAGTNTITKTFVYDSSKNVVGEWTQYLVLDLSGLPAGTVLDQFTTNAVLTDWQPVTKGGAGQSVGTNVSMYCYDDADHALEYHKNTTNFSNLRAKVVTNTTPGTTSSDSQLQIIIPNTSIYTQDSEGNSLVQGNQYELTMSYTSSAAGTMRIDANPYGSETAAAIASYGNTISKTFIYDDDNSETSSTNTVIHLKGFSANTEISNISFTITPKEWIDVIYDDPRVTVGNAGLWCGPDDGAYSHNFAYRRTATDYDDMQVKITNNGAETAAELSDAADNFGMNIRISNSAIYTAANNGGENLIPGGKYQLTFTYKTTATGTMRIATDGYSATTLKADSTAIAPQINTIQTSVFEYASSMVGNDQYTYIYLTGFPTDAVLSDFTFALTGGALPAEGLSVARTSDTSGTITFSAPSGASSSQRYNVYVDGSPYESLTGVTAGTHTISAGVGYSTDHTIEVRAVVDGIESAGVSATMDKWITASTTNDWVDVGSGGYCYKIATNYSGKYTEHNSTNPLSIKALTGTSQGDGGEYEIGKKFTGLTSGSIYDYTFTFSRDTNITGTGTTVWLKAEFFDSNGDPVGSVQGLDSAVFTSASDHQFNGSLTVPSGATQVILYAVPAWGSINEVFAVAESTLAGGVLDPVSVSAERRSTNSGIVYYSNPSGVTQSYNIYVDGVRVATNREQGSYTITSIPDLVSDTEQVYTVTVKGVANGVESDGVSVDIDKWITGYPGSTPDGSWQAVWGYAYACASGNTMKYTEHNSTYPFSIKLGESDGTNAQPYKVGLIPQTVVEGGVYQLSTVLHRSLNVNADAVFWVDYYDSSDVLVTSSQIGVGTFSSGDLTYTNTFTVPTNQSIAKARVYVKPAWGTANEVISIESMTLTGGALNPTELSVSRTSDAAVDVTFGHLVSGSEYAQQYKVYLNDVLYSETNWNPGTISVNAPVVVNDEVVETYTIKVVGIKNGVMSSGATITADKWITGTADDAWHAIWGFAYNTASTNTIKYTTHNNYQFSVKLGESDAVNSQPYKVGLIPRNVDEGGVYKLSAVLHRNLNQNTDAVFWVDYYDSSDALVTSSQIGVGTFSSGDLTYNNTFTVPTGQSITKARVYAKPAWGTANEIIDVESMAVTGGAFDPVISSYNRLTDNSGNVIVANPTVGGATRGETYNIYVDGTLVSSGNYPGTISISDIPVLVDSQVHDYTIKVTGVYDGVESAGTTSTFTIDKWITGTADNNWQNVTGGNNTIYSYKTASTKSIKHTTHNGEYPISFKFGEYDDDGSRPYYIGLPAQSVLAGGTYQLDASVYRTSTSGAAVQFYVDYYDSSDALVSTATIGAAQSTVAGALTYSNTFEVPTGGSITKARVYCRPLYAGTDEEFSISSMTVTGGVLNPEGVYTNRESESRGYVHFSNATGGTGLFNVYVDGTRVSSGAWPGQVTLDYPDYVNNQVKTYEVVVKGVDSTGTIESSGVTVTLDKWIDADSTKGVWQTPATPGDYSYKMVDDEYHEGTYSRHNGYAFSFKEGIAPPWGYGYYIGTSLRTVTPGAQYAYSATFNSSLSGGGRTLYFYIEDASGNRLTFTPTGGSAATEDWGQTAASDGSITFTGLIDIPAGITQVRMFTQVSAGAAGEVISIDADSLSIQETWYSASNNEWVDVNDYGYCMETYSTDATVLAGEYSISYRNYPLSIRGDLGGTNIYGGRYKIGTRLLSAEEDTPYNYEIGFHRSKDDLTNTKMIVIALFSDGSKQNLGVTDIDSEGNLVVTPDVGSPNFAAHMDANNNIICSGTVTTPAGAESMRIYAQFSWEGASEKFSVMSYEISSIPAFDLVNDGTDVKAIWDDEEFENAVTLRYTSDETTYNESVSSVTQYTFSENYPNNKSEVLLLDSNGEVIGRKVALADLVITQVRVNGGGQINSNTNNTVNIQFKNIGVARVDTGGEEVYAKATTGDDWYNYSVRKDLILTPNIFYTADIYGFRPMEPGNYTIKTSINEKTSIRESNYNNNKHTDTFTVRTQIEDDTAVLGFQINTNKAENSPSEFNPSYRAVCRATKRVYPEDGPSEGYAVTGYGLLYSYTDAADMSKPLDELKFAADGGRVGADGEEYFKSYAASGSMDYTGWTTHDSQYNEDNSNFYALTIYDLYYTTQSYERVLTYRSYLQYVDGSGVTHTVYPKDVYSASLYEIAEDLYKYQKMPTEEGHKFMYDNILNIVSMKHNNTDIGKAMLTALEVPKGTRNDDYYMANMCYKDIYYYALCTNGYMYADYSVNDENGGKVAEPPYTHDHEFQSIQLDKSTNPSRTSAILLSRLNTATDTSYGSIPDWIRGCVGKNVNSKDMTGYQGMYKKKAYSWDSNLDKDYGSE